MIVKEELATVYWAGNGRRYLTKKAAYRHAAKAKLRSRCECQSAGSDPFDDPGYTCRLHQEGRYQKIVRRLVRVYMAADREG